MPAQLRQVQGRRAALIRGNGPPGSNSRPLRIRGCWVGPVRIAEPKFGFRRIRGILVWPPRISRRKVGLPGSGGEKWAPQDRPPQDQQAKSGPFQIACSKVVRMRSWHPDRAPEHRKLGSNRIGYIRMGRQGSERIIRVLAPSHMKNRSAPYEVSAFLFPGAASCTRGGVVGRARAALPPRQ